MCDLEDPGERRRGRRRGAYTYQRLRKSFSLILPPVLIITAGQPSWMIDDGKKDKSGEASPQATVSTVETMGVRFAGSRRAVPSIGPWLISSSIRPSVRSMRGTEGRQPENDACHPEIRKAPAHLLSHGNNIGYHTILDYTYICQSWSSFDV